MRPELKWTIFASVDVPARRDSGLAASKVDSRSFPAFEKLEVGTYPGDAGVYLLRLCSDSQVADTWHESFDDAFHQAEFEFKISKDRWTVSPEKLTS